MGNTKTGTFILSGVFLERNRVSFSRRSNPGVVLAGPKTFWLTRSIGGQGRGTLLEYRIGILLLPVAEGPARNSTPLRSWTNGREDNHYYFSQVIPGRY